MEIRGKTIPSPVTHIQEKNNEREKQLMFDMNTMPKTWKQLRTKKGMRKDNRLGILYGLVIHVLL